MPRISYSNPTALIRKALQALNMTVLVHLDVSIMLGVPKCIKPFGLSSRHGRASQEEELKSEQLTGSDSFRNGALKVRDLDVSASSSASESHAKTTSGLGALSIAASILTGRRSK